MMQFLLYAYFIPVGAFIAVLCLLAIQSMKSTRESEVEGKPDPRLRELEILNKMYSMEVEQAQPYDNALHPGSR